MTIVRIYMFLQIVTEYMQSWGWKMWTIHSTKSSQGKLFCIFENISWVREYLANFVNCEKNILISEKKIFWTIDHHFFFKRSRSDSSSTFLVCIIILCSYCYYRTIISLCKCEHHLNNFLKNIVLHFFMFW